MKQFVCAKLKLMDKNVSLRVESKEKSDQCLKDYCVNYF